MKAELDLLPILKLAFARDPRAYQGWQSMTPLQRRYYLLGIFYCRTPECRDGRISKMLEDERAEWPTFSRNKPEKVGQPSRLNGLRACRGRHQSTLACSLSQG